MKAVRFAGKLILLAAVLALMVVLMFHLHIATYAYLLSALSGSLAIYLWTRPSLPSLGTTALIGTGLATLYGIIQGAQVVTILPAFLGLGSLATLTATILWGPGGKRRANIDTCLAASLFPIFLVVSGFSLVFTTLAHVRTYDRFLYAFDERLGGHPGFMIGQLLANCAPLSRLCYFGYEALPLAMAIAFALERSGSGVRRSSIVPAFIAAAAGGFFLYNVYPAVGPIHVFGSLFPYTPPLAGSPPFQLTAAGDAPRNAMPSVHIAMALLILWNSRSEPRIWRWLAGALLIVTILATLGFGEHYVVDLCVAVPFALLARAVAASHLSWKSVPRIAGAGMGGLMVTAWLAYLRLPSPPLMGRTLAWMLLLITVAASVKLEWRLHRASPAIHADEHPRLSALGIVGPCRV